MSEFLSFFFSYLKTSLQKFTIKHQPTNLQFCCLVFDSEPQTVSDHLLQGKRSFNFREKETHFIQAHPPWYGLKLAVVPMIKPAKNGTKNSSTQDSECHHGQHVTDLCTKIGEDLSCFG